MHRTISTALGIAMSIFIPAAALDFNSSSAGSLSGAIADPAAVGELRLSGVVDASDLYYIGSEMLSLHTLDLSAAEIVAYSGKALQGISRHEANTIPAAAFAGTSVSSLTLPAAAGLHIGDAAFAGTAIAELTLPANVAYIGQGAFSGCLKLRSVDIATAAPSGGHAFSQCAALHHVNYSVPAAVGAADFSGCSELYDVKNLEFASSIGAEAFAGCTALTYVGFGDNLQSIGERAFYGSGLRSVEAGRCKALTAVGAWAFADCKELRRADLPESLAEIGRGAFFGCPGLLSVNLPSRCRRVADYLFHGDSMLDTDQALHDGIESIGAYALKDNTRAQSIHIPVALDRMDDGAMEGMTALRSIYAKGVGSVAELGDEVWRGVDPSQVFLYVDPDMADAFRAADQWREFNISTSSLTGLQTEGLGHVSAGFDGRVLTVVAGAAEICAVTVYDIGGTRVAAALPDGPSADVRVDTSHRADHIFIADVLMADGSHRIFKLGRP